MYTNINTDHALLIILQFLQTSPICADITTEPIIKALSIIMKNNLFQFGDTYWLQISGVAMGAPPACTIAMIYYYIRECSFLPLFPSITFYTRYIDDGFLIWNHHPDTTIDQMNLDAFNNYVNFGDL